MKNSRVSNFILLVCCLLILASVTISKPFPHHDQYPHPKEATFSSKQRDDGQKSSEGFSEKYEGEEYFRGRLMTRLGSIPPNCAHRCQDCVPCLPVQMPTTTDHIQVQYANYEPEGWKCKCDSTFFNP